MAAKEKEKGGNANFHEAKKNQNDEFYTQYDDIQAEMNAYVEHNPDVFRDKTILLPCDDPEWSNFTRFFIRNFENYGIKKLISTSYANNSKNKGRAKNSLIPHQITLDEASQPDYDEEFSKAHGKVFILDRNSCTFPVNEESLDWYYLKGDGDFRSDEVKKLRDEADVICTNPPFSLFREFLKWIMEAEKEFIIIGNMNAITYKEVFPLIRDNKLWLGASIHSGDREFRVPDSYPLNAAGWRQDADGTKYIRVKGVRWFTNIEHAWRHKELEMMSMADNIRYNKKKKFKDEGYYQKYDNYDALNCPLTEVIPSDYVPCWFNCDKADKCQFCNGQDPECASDDNYKPCNGVMGVPISFLDKYNPDQFEIVAFRKGEDSKDLVFTRERERESSTTLSHPCSTSIPGMIKNAEGKINGQITYARITIRRKLNQ